MTNSMTVQDAINRRAYHRPGVVRTYRDTALDSAEAHALSVYRAAFAGRRVLDLGVGTGRTTRHLAPVASRYVAADYSPFMVDRVREQMSEIDVRLLDMRDLSVFASASFDCVCAFQNLLDAVSHDDRLAVLAEVRRVLSDAGTFIFSSHNLDYRFAASGPRLGTAKHPVAQLRQLALYALRIWNHMRVRRYRRWEPRYALLNDPGHHFALLHYYVKRHVQAEQLRNAGFELLDAFARNGRRLGESDSTEDSPDILYVARRAPGP